MLGVRLESPLCEDSTVGLDDEVVSGYLWLINRCSLFVCCLV